jgi:hypothetical protein
VLCIECGKDKKIAARGLCAACYYRVKYRGGLPRVNFANVGKKCMAEGCALPAFSKGFCLKHYQTSVQHPLKATWKILRSRHSDIMPASWEKFTVFRAEVGDRPTAKHRLKRLDDSKPFSKENAYWMPPMKVNRTSPEYNRAWTARKKYGLSEDRHAEMHAAQNGLCAICGGVDEQIIKRSGKTKELAIDHCHTTNKVRGLLCSHCNQGLGHFKENAELLRAAAAYLESHGRNTKQP